MRVVPGNRDTTSASEIEDLPSDIVENNSINDRVESVSVVDYLSDLNTEISSENQVQSKVSTSVGTSPPPEVKTKPSVNDVRSKRTRTISTGTSPPPQNISTQVDKMCQQNFHSILKICECFTDV